MSNSVIIRRKARPCTVCHNSVTSGTLCKPCVLAQKVLDDSFRKGLIKKGKPSKRGNHDPIEAMIVIRERHAAQLKKKPNRKPRYPKLKAKEGFCANCSFSLGKTRKVNQKRYSFDYLTCGCGTELYAKIGVPEYGSTCPECKEVYRPTVYREPIAIICMDCGRDRMQAPPQARKHIEEPRV